MKSVARIACPECLSTQLIKFGVKFNNRRIVQQYQCKNCGRITIYPKLVLKESVK